MSGGFHTLISGETGTGKSVIIEKFLKTLDEDKFISSVVNFSAQTTTTNI
jgi:dynein heavy chain